MRIVSFASLDKTQVLDAMERMECELFSSGAWSRQSIERELYAVARYYWFVLDDSQEKFNHKQCSISSHSNEDKTLHKGNAALPIVAYAGYWYDDQDAELMTLAVTPRYQHQGIGKTLLSHVMSKAFDQGAQRMLLEVRIDNIPAIGLYRQLGFTRIGLRKRYYQPEDVDALVMAADLTGTLTNQSVL